VGLKETFKRWPKEFSQRIKDHQEWVDSNTVRGKRFVWKEGDPKNLDKVNLSNADLRGADFSGGNFREADLSCSDLTGANLVGSLGLSKNQIKTSYPFRKILKP